MILAIDPGKNKCGLAVLDLKGNTLQKHILARKDITESLPFYIKEYNTSTLVIGQGAFGKELEKEIAGLELKTNIVFISEYGSTLEARKAYWKDNRPKGLWRLIPSSLREPPCPVDDYAAVILGRRYLKG